MSSQDELEKRKRPHSRVRPGNFSNTCGVDSDYLGGSVGLGVVGFGVTVPVGGLVAAGFGVAPEAGAATPDWAL